MSTEERFWSKVDKNGPNGCWLWTAGLNIGGYGRFALTHTKPVPAHRFAYELLVGPVPEGLELDHVKAWGCHNRHCVNPDHLEPVTPQENMDRSDCPGVVNRNKTHCIRGHPFAGDNLYVRPNGKRECIECKRMRKWRDRERRST